jgi:hypothetical protein
VSSATQRRRWIITPDWRPAFLRPKQKPVLVDGLLELERAYQVMQLLADLPESSQARVLWHVEAISKENAQIRHDFETAAQVQPTTRPNA